MLHFVEYAKIFVALMVIVNPISSVPTFLSMTARYSVRERMQIARVASMSVAIVLVLSALVGEPVLALFGITIASFKVGGAILIMLTAISMMHALPSRESQTPEEVREAERKENIAVVPLAIPLLSGPGAISTTIIYATAKPSAAHLGAIVVCCLLVALLTWIILRLAAPASRWLGETGVNIATRLMGLLLAAVAVEIFMSGLLEFLPGLKSGS
ncbi:MAG: NAAT family transporter [Betaproteobacteria bacterium]|nr:NAAT family transporter [Betaproteobacteria bacterium]